MSVYILFADPKGQIEFVSDEQFCYHLLKNFQNDRNRQHSTETNAKDSFFV